MGRRKKEKLNILKLSLGHQESSGLMGTVIAEMPGKTISELSALPKRAKWIKHLSSCVGSKNNYSVIYYCKKGLISAKLSEKKAFKFYAFVAVGGFDLDGLNESLCVCVCKCHNMPNKQGSEEPEYGCIWTLGKFRFMACLYFGTTNWAKAFTQTHPGLWKVQFCIQSLVPCLLLP